MRTLRLMLRLALAVLAILSLLLVVTYGWLRSGFGEGSLDRVITLLAQKEGAFFVRAEGVSGSLPEHLRVRKVEVGDAYGVWLTVENAEASWYPFDLVHRFDPVKWRIHVDKIHAERVQWTRLPRDRPDEVDTPFRWDSFIRIIVGHLVVDDFDLSGDILGGARAHLRAEGSGVLGEWDHGSLKLDIEHIDDVAGKARIDLATHRAAPGAPLDLSGTITAEEAPGGALAALARLPDAGAVRLDVRASGPMRGNWNADADVTASGIGRLLAKTTLSYTADGPFEVSGSFDPVAEQRERWLVGEGAPIALAASGAWAPDVELRLDRVRLEADGRELLAEGRLDLATHEFQVGGRLAAGGNEAVRLTLLDVSGARVDGHGVLGDGGNLVARLDVDEAAAGDASAERVEVSFQASDAPGDSVPQFELSAVADGLTLYGERMPLLGDQARVAASGRIDLSAGALQADKLRVEGEALTVEGPLSIGDRWSSMTASLNADASSLASLTDVFDTSVSGSATASVDVTARPGWRDFDVKVHADAAGVAIGESGWNALIGPTVTLDASMRGALRGPAHAELQLGTAGIAASATADVGDNGNGLVADARVSLDNLSRLADPARAAIAGRLDATAAARGSLDDFDLDVAIKGERLAWEGVRFDTFTADVDAAGLPQTWSAAVHMKGRSGQSDAALDADVSMPSPQRLVVRGLELRGPGTTGNADLDIDLEGRVAGGTLRLASEELSRWRSMTGMAIGGSVTVDLALAVAPGAGTEAATQQVSGSAALRNVAIAVGETELFIDALEAGAQDLAIGPRPRGSARVHASRVRYGARTLMDGVATASGNGRVWNLETTLDVRGEEDVSVSAAGTLLPGDAIELTLERASGTVETIPVALRAPARVRVEGPQRSTWSVAPVAIVVKDSGHLTGEISSETGTVRAAAHAKDLPLALVSVFVPALDLDGTIEGSVKLTGADVATATGDIALRGHDVVSTGLEARGVEPVDLQADLRMAGGRITGSAAVAGLTSTRLELRLDAPLVATSGAAPVVIDLAWKGSIAEVAALLPMGEDAVAGRIDAQLRLSGSVAAPRVTGRAVVDGASWENEDTGLVLRDIHAELEGAGTALVLRSLTATDGGKGTVRAGGNIRFADFPAFDAQVELEATDAVLTRLDLLTMRSDAKLTLKVSRAADKDADVAGSITGSVGINDARVEIPQRFVAAVPEIDVVEIGRTVEGEAGDSDDGPAMALALDVSVRGDNRIFVTGRGLESEWSSDVHVRGDTTDARIEGDVTSVRGQLSLLGRRFDVTSAKLHFDGSRDNEPYLTMTARAEANDITAIAEVTGPAMHPVIELRSEPSLPRDEVLSRLLFGQSAANLTPLQSVQLARSVAELTGSPLGGGSGFLSDIGRSIGFDRIGIDSSGPEGDAALTASRYLTDNVYLRVQQGLTPEASKLSLEWKIMKHITIESDVSQDAQGEVGATWRWDY